MRRTRSSFFRCKEKKCILYLVVRHWVSVLFLFIVDSPLPGVGRSPLNHTPIKILPSGARNRQERCPQSCPRVRFWTLRSRGPRRVDPIDSLALLNCWWLVELPCFICIHDGSPIKGSLPVNFWRTTTAGDNAVLSIA